MNRPSTTGSPQETRPRLPSLRGVVIGMGLLLALGGVSLGLGQWLGLFHPPSCALLTDGHSPVGVVIGTLSDVVALVAFAAFFTLWVIKAFAATNEVRYGQLNDWAVAAAFAAIVGVMTDPLVVWASSVVCGLGPAG